MKSFFKATLPILILIILTNSSKAVIRGGYIEWEVVNHDSINVFFNVYYDCAFSGISNNFKVITNNCGSKSFGKHNLPKPIETKINLMIPRNHTTTKQIDLCVF
ncbi:MAG: hypothetical protein ACPGLV_18940, partial [Bacteroidia bacterium]